MKYFSSITSVLLSPIKSDYTQDKLLNDGLADGYAGNAERKTVQVGPFTFEETEYRSPDGGIYIDRWIADQLGGGQEIAQSGDEKNTRVYTGGVASKDILDGLGISKKVVTNHLKEFIKGSDGKTRLSEDYFQQEEDWIYSYKIIQSFSDQGIPLIIGAETIQYKGTLVFAHGFSRSPIK